ncbi:hypothetical protein NQD34_014905 [Periophthalmus magnuspinnatus]|nr:hypothetical protein NQD34_014905 [Periophthalmus magnuspinnatus]
MLPFLSLYPPSHSLLLCSRSLPSSFLCSLSPFPLSSCSLFVTFSFHSSQQSHSSSFSPFSSLLSLSSLYFALSPPSSHSPSLSSSVPSALFSPSLSPFSAQTLFVSTWDLQVGRASAAPLMFLPALGQTTEQERGRDDF